LSRASVTEGKVREYLLSPAHPAGRHKARFFRRFGFSEEAWQDLAEAILRHGQENAPQTVEETRFGRKYVVEAPLAAPDGRRPVVRTVWFVPTGRSEAHLVTAYPPRGEEFR
jgi:hypothetical protein